MAVGGPSPGVEFVYSMLSIARSTDTQKDEKKRKRKITQALKTLPTSIKEKRIPRAKAPFVLDLCGVLCLLHNTWREGGGGGGGGGGGRSEFGMIGQNQYSIRTTRCESRYFRKIHGKLLGGMKRRKERMKEQKRKKRKGV
eukprot:1158743-Pelagomonas_calceolata.AAC.41